ncbi:unnamed protein product [Clonostachys rosea f. rosea IK726]|uniref:Uncharacterized protein n=1 Tax=Clonostachys rosea f. rosea IK726 TaxID=1349383 RepID=A0ACA9UCA1_BIOOC|nr:unnamed protein product [Clonostachys rosea f. rosea IK726]
MATLGLDDDELKSVEADGLENLPALEQHQQLEARPAEIRTAPPSILLPGLSPDPAAQPPDHPRQHHENSELFSQMAVHPSTNYPGRTQEGLLSTLLRSKLEPQMEERVSLGLETAHRATPEGIAVLQEYVSEEADDVYTKQERDAGVENVRTGLRRELEEDESDDDDEGEDEDEVDDRMRGSQQQQQQQQGAPPVTRGPEPETLLWFAARGDFSVPRISSLSARWMCIEGCRASAYRLSRCSKGEVSDGGRTDHHLNIPKDETGVELVIEHRTPTRLSFHTVNVVGGQVRFLGRS